MRVINVSLSELESKVLLIGFEGENQITQVRIDAAEILTDYPNATPTLIVKPLFGFAYPVIVAMEGTDVVWEIDNSVLSFHGDGEIQLTFTQGTVIAKSYVGRIRIKRSLAVNGEAPDPIETWEQAATAKLAEVDAQIVELEGMVDTATDAATRAEQSASTASAEATSAAGSASAAASSATNANTAKTDAQTAKTAAETAQEKAEEAQAAAEAAAQTLVIDDTLTQANQAAEAKAVGDALKTKAEIDGYYQDMTVGDAEQLVSSQYVEDKVPYKFRTSGGSADVGNREYVDKIVGGTIAWNQLMPDAARSNTSHGVLYSRAAKSPYILSGTATDGNAVFTLTGNIIAQVGHKYLLLGGIEPNAYVALSNVNVWGSTNPQDNGSGIIGNARIAAEFQVALVIMNGTVVDGKKVNPQLFDLTQMFGSAVADAVYAMEQSTAGAGVAWFRAMFPNDYYEYNAGELISVSGLQSHDTVGFNQWDEEWDSGYINNTTGKKVSGGNVRSKNYISVVPSQVYYCKSQGYAMNVMWYADDKSYISYSTATDGIVTAPANARYALFFMNANYGTAYKGDLCFNLAWSGTRNGEYQPYVKHSYPLDSSLTLRGIPKLSADNQMYFDGDEYLPEGKVNRRYGIVDLGTLNWSSDGTHYVYNAQVDDMKKIASNIMPNIICVYETIRSSYASNLRANMSDKTATLIDSNNQVIIRDDAYTSTTAFKTAMSGVYLVYELATPTEETADAYQAIQLVDDWGTEEYVSGTICPVGHVTRYPIDLVKKLEGLPTDIQVNGVSIVQDGVANVPIASADSYGVVRTGSVSVSGTTPTINALSGVRYVCEEVSTITITVPASGIIDVVFTSGSTPAVLTINGTVRWANGFDPDNLDADTVYELNIADGLGVAVGWT